MENPATWNEVQKAIDEAITDYAESVGQGVCGLSLVSVIYTKLKGNGHLHEHSPDS